MNYTRGIWKVLSMVSYLPPQCVDKMLSNNTFFETRIQRLHDGLFFCRKRTWRARAAHAQNE